MRPTPAVAVAWDESPPDLADKSPLVGRKVIDAMHAAEAGHWHGGRLYNPEDRRDDKGSLHLQSPTRLLVEGGGWTKAAAHRWTWPMRDVEGSAQPGAAMLAACSARSSERHGSTHCCVPLRWPS